MKLIRDASEKEVLDAIYCSDVQGKCAGNSFREFLDAKKFLFDNLPPKRAWKEAAITPEDYASLRVMGSSPLWAKVESGTLLDALRLIESGKEEWSRTREGINAICGLAGIDATGIVLITDAEKKFPFTIIEGHHRILALLKQGKFVEKAFVGFCRGESIWMRNK
ncbi:Uncharacterised protein [uncultured archaeon]|nr:Uncharacterised protein [uncultured archaeon]